MLRKTILIHLLILLCILLSVQATTLNFNRADRWIIDAYETVYFSPDEVNVTFRSDTQIDGRVKNVSLFFYPNGNQYFENYADQVGLRLQSGDSFHIDKEVNYSKSSNKSYVAYNFSLEPTECYKILIFSANYSLENSVYKIDNINYIFTYYSQGEAQNREISFLFPYKYEVIKKQDNLGEWEYNPYYQVFTSSNSENRIFNFVLRDTKAVELSQEKEKEEERNHSFWLTIYGAFVGAVFGLIFSFFYQIITSEKRDTLYIEISNKKEKK